MVNNSIKSSIPFSESTQAEVHPSSESSTSSAQQPAHLRSKKKESILRKISTSSRRSLSWLPGVNDPLHRQQQPPNLPASSGASLSSLSSTDQNSQQTREIRTTSSNSKVKFIGNAITATTPKPIIPPNSDKSTKSDHPLTKTVLSKGIRSVARTVKRSLHQFERPRSIVGDHPDRNTSNGQQDSQARSSSQHPNGNRNSFDRQSSPQRTRAVSTSEVYVAQSRDTRVHQPSQSLGRSSALQTLDPDRDTRLNSPPALPKRPRPQSAFQLEAMPSTRVSNCQQHERLTWHAQAHVGSLPMAATLLAAPSPPPVDHSTFLAIIPGQKANAVIPSLSVMPPAASQAVEPAALTGTSIRVEPALSRRVSLSSSAGGANAPDDNGFTFIRTPSSKSDFFNPSPTTPSTPLPTGISSPEWTEILAQSSTIESLKTRPPLVSMSTTISLVQSCVAERGSINEFEEFTHHEQSIGYQVTAPYEESTLTEVHRSDLPGPSLQHEDAKTESRKRKEMSQTVVEAIEEQTKSSPSEEVPSEGIGRQHKVLRAMDQPFSSSATATAIGVNHESSHSLSVLTATGGRATPTKHLIHRLQSKIDSSNSPRENPPRNSKRGKHPSKSSPGTPKNLPSFAHSKKHDRNGTEIWNKTIVSTVVGVVILAAVLIGSTNFSNLNGKSWIGNLIKKI